MLCGVVVQAIELQPELDHGPVAYEFHWSVNDPHTGDIKSQKETRKDDQVQGQYSLVDSDGYIRIVEYTSDAHNGFNAIVRREPTDIKIPQPAPEPKKLILAAPTKILAAPIAPLVHYAAAPKAILKAEAPSEGNYVSVSGPTAQYKYWVQVNPDHASTNIHTAHRELSTYLKRAPVALACFIIKLYISLSSCHTLYINSRP